MMFPGFYGLAAGFAVLIIVWLIVHLKTKKDSDGMVFHFDAKGEKGAFEKLLPIYLDFGKFILGLATGSIVLLVGSSALHSTGRLPQSFASPLLLLFTSIFCGIFFMMLLIVDYEDYRHDLASPSYTRRKYVRNQVFGFSSVICFCLGYVWLIFGVLS